MPGTDRPDRSVAVEHCRLIDASPSPFHAVATAAGLLADAGFDEVSESESWPAEPGGRFFRREGALVAWSAGEDPPAAFRLIGAHTDSPNLRIKPRADRTSAGVRQLGVEVYGGALLNSWLDRDLGLSGRVAIRTPDGVEERLFCVDRPLLRVPQLAIHLDRQIRDEGLKLNEQQHMAPMWALAPSDGGSPDEGGFVDFLACEAGADPADVLAWDAMTHDLTPSRLWGRHEEFVAAPRLDNLCSSFAAVRSLIAAGRDTAAVPVVVLFDHEEVGSTSARGADSTLVATTLERIVAAVGGDRDAYLRALPASLCVSADMAHATHPNYADRHEPEHHVRLNGGPVVKANANLRYASDATSVAAFLAACRDAGVPTQRFVNRTAMPCGSTIGPVTAARLGIPTVDVGIAQLAMHSARETCGSADPALYERALTAFLQA